MDTGWKGEFRLEIQRKDKELEVIEFPNLITNAWLNAIRSATMSVTPTDLQIKFIALGKDDGTTLPLASTNTRLGNEIFRKNFAKVELDGLGRVKRTAIISSSEANFHIKEIGIYAGSTATTNLNTGILVARVFYDRDKDELESINIVRTDTVGRL